MTAYILVFWWHLITVAARAPLAVYKTSARFIFPWVHSSTAFASSPEAELCCVSKMNGRITPSWLKSMSRIESLSLSSPLFSSIHITFTLSKYDTKRNLMFYQNISVKHRLSFLCFGNVRVDVDDGFFCLGIAVWWFPLKFSHWTQEYQRVCSTILETCYRLDMCCCVFFLETTASSLLSK